MPNGLGFCTGECVAGSPVGFAKRMAGNSGGAPTPLHSRRPRPPAGAVRAQSFLQMGWRTSSALRKWLSMDEGSITRLIRDTESGVPGAEDRLFERVYEELRAMAAAAEAKERNQPAEGSTEDLVHDAYRRMNGAALENRRHLFFAYARAMRQILVERARKRNALRRGGGRAHVSLKTGVFERALSVNDDAADVAELVVKLRKEDERASDVVDLRFFGGLSMTQIAQVLGVSERTVDSDWAHAKQRLQEWLSE